MPCKEEKISGSPLHLVTETVFVLSEVSSTSAKNDRRAFSPDQWFYLSFPASRFLLQ